MDMDSGGQCLSDNERLAITAKLKDKIISACDDLSQLGEESAFFSVDMNSELAFSTGSMIGRSFLNQQPETMDQFYNYCKFRYTSPDKSVPLLLPDKIKQEDEREPVGENDVTTDFHDVTTEFDDVTTKSGDVTTKSNDVTTKSNDVTSEAVSDDGNLKIPGIIKNKNTTVQISNNEMIQESQGKDADVYKNVGSWDRNVDSTIVELSEEDMSNSDSEVVEKLTKTGNIRKTDKNSGTKKQKRQEKGVKCEICSVMFYNMNKIKSHMKSHEQKESYRCDVCNIDIFNKESYRIHMQLHEGLKLQKGKQGQSSLKSQSSRSLDIGDQGQSSSKSQNKTSFRDQGTLSSQGQRWNKDKNEMIKNYAGKMSNLCVNNDNRLEHVENDNDEMLSGNLQRTGPNSLKGASNFSLNEKSNKNEQIVFTKFVHMSAKEHGFVEKSTNSMKENDKNQKKKNSENRSEIRESHENSLEVKQSQENRLVINQSDRSKGDISLSDKNQSGGVNFVKSKTKQLITGKFESQSGGSLHDKNKILETRNSDKTFNCKACPHSYTDLKSFVNHTKTHRNIGLCVCTICGRQLSSKQSLENHLLLHRGIKQHVCQVCNKSYITAGALKRHSLKHEKDHILYKCTNCFEGFLSEKLLNKHWEKVCANTDLLSESGSENSIKMADTQNGQCESKRGRKRKRKKQNSSDAEKTKRLDKDLLNDGGNSENEKSLNVDEYEITCISSEDEEDILPGNDGGGHNDGEDVDDGDSHDDDNDDEFNELLDTSNRQQNSNIELKNSLDHENDVSEDEEEILLGNDGGSHNDGEDVDDGDSHDDDDDNDEFDELLETSNRQQNSNIELKNSLDHENDVINSLRTLYRCDICGKVFIDQASLTIHNQRHITDKMFKCEVCGKGFIHKHNLTVHKRLHEGEVVNLNSSQE